MLQSTLKLLSIVLWIAVCYPFGWLANAAHKISWRKFITRLCYRGILRIIGIKLKVNGKVSDVRPLLVVSNHVSYLDVIILGACASLRFTPKSEIASWPVIGNICRLIDCVFVNRSPEAIKDTREKIFSALSRGDVVSLFPEATTGNGVHILPFKSAFFSLMEEKINGCELAVQPVALSYTRIRRLPIDSTQWPSIAWYGDMDLVPHLWEMLQLGPMDAEVTFLSPTTLSPHGDRKKVAQFCQDAITQRMEMVRSSISDSQKP